MKEKQEVLFRWVMFPLGLILLYAVDGVCDVLIP